MHAMWLVGGAVAGALAANLLRGAVFRLSTPEGEPARSACPGCGSTLGRGRLSLGRCGGCRRRLGLPLGVPELATAALVAVLAGVLGPRPELVGFGWLAVAGVALAQIDLAVYRLPNRVVYPAISVVLASFAVGALTGTDPARLERGLAGAAVLGACYLLLAVVAPGQLGLGDVKLSVLLGLALGWVGWPALLLGGCLAFLLSAGTSLVLLALRRITLKSALPFGPFMLLGAALALFA